MDKNKDIGSFFKEKLEGYRVEPSPGVWENIEQNLSSSAAPGASGWSVSPWWLAPAAAVLVGAAVYLFTAQPKSDPVVQAPKADTNRVTERSMPEEEKESGDDLTQLPADTMEFHYGQEESSIASRETVARHGEAEDGEERVQEPAEDSRRHTSPPTPEEVPPVSPLESRELSLADTPPGARHLDTTGREHREIPPAGKILREDQYAAADSAVNIRFSQHDEPVCVGDEVTLWASGGEKYQWFNGSTDSSISLVPDPAVSYSVTVLDPQGREVNHEYKLKLKECGSLFVPNAFVPNGNGINDYFRAYGVGINEFRMQIMDRNGNVVFETTQINQGWNGEYQNRQAPTGVYLYHIVYTGVEGETKTKTGTLTLIR